ncbi:uncharacterized protein LAESUDRAFT_726745 [Laetiporus sulphureus 93-53]|uniref:Protein-S-isoprenylcysteine O-methyltransferase n=1 Tax=Laetiporus sulphureus 93-53 TaxID=1314785 RepID=A0A165DWU8_9APHY|nr:uncharacterized protein LAESUDRAFT_726745 [Laetiporus sulphureus 93-53]KZT05792.1 hypothetical protein LAESUDRAFT_726745 [Laetiporus sulphureus 93-53]
MLATSVFKAGLLIITVLGHYVSLTPPCPPSSKGDKVYRGQPFERVVMFLIDLDKVTVALVSVAHIAVMLFLSVDHPGQHGQHGQLVLSHLCPSPAPRLETLASLSPAFLFGVSMIMLGSLLRMRCYTALGAQFTYLVTVKPRHSLVTSGPYKYVRHPSYAGLWLLFLGTYCAFRTPSEYIDQCGLMLTPAKWFVHGFFVLYIFAMLSVVKRGRVEDKLLETAIGKEWLEYRERVPYSMIPGMY